jgi:carboxyl-terminal processing protease
MRGKPGTKITLTVARKGEGKPLTFTLTRAVIKIQSVKSKLAEDGYGYIRVTQFQEHTGENLAKAVDVLYKQNKEPLKGLVLDLRNDPGGLLNGAVGVAAAFLPKDALVTYTDGRTDDAKMRLTASKQHYLHGMGQEDYLKNLPEAVKKVPMVWSTAVRLGVGNCRRRLAGSQARHHHGHPDLRQGLGADRAAARQQHRHQAHHGALLHPRRTLDPGQGHHPRHHRR